MEKVYNSFSSSEIYTVKRGDPINEGQTITKVWNQVNAGKIKECDLAGVIKRIKENKWNYSGAFYSVMLGQ